MEYAIRITDKCNLNCAYCYARTENPKDMSAETLKRVMAEVAASTADPITISWTGGEPLTMGYEFFGLIEKNLAAHGPERFTNILQSNLILTDERHIAFLRRNRFEVRTSLDLPPENHDKLRKRGDFARALACVEKLRNAGVPVNINTVVTERNIGSPQEIFRFLKDNGITSFSVSRLVEQGNAAARQDLAVYDNAAFGRFLVALFDLWMADNAAPKIERITPIDKLIRACRTGARDEKSKCFHCQSQLFAIGPDGGVFPSCNKFFALPETCLGNIETNTIPEILSSAKRTAFLEVAGDVSKRACGRCEYLDVCEGGCYYIAYNAHARGDHAQSREQFCKGYYLVFERIYDYFGLKAR